MATAKKQPITAEIEDVENVEEIDEIPIDEFRLTSGRILKLKKIKTGPIQSLILKIGGPEFINHPERIGELKGKKQWRAINAVGQLFDYCAGWGVDEKPDEDALELLEALGADLEKPHLTRSLWLRSVLFDNENEAGLLIAAVMAYAYSE